MAHPEVRRAFKKRPLSRPKWFVAGVVAVMMVNAITLG
jgi:hypothetical protein